MTDKLGSMIIVGATRFQPGVKVEVVQDAIDRLRDRNKEMMALLLRVENHKHRLPPTLEADLTEFLKGAHIR